MQGQTTGQAPRPTLDAKRLTLMSVRCRLVSHRAGLRLESASLAARNGPSASPVSQAREALTIYSLHARQRGPGERATAQLKSWKVLRKIRCCPTRATTLVNAIQALILAS